MIPYTLYYSPYYYPRIIEFNGSPMFTPKRKKLKGYQKRK